MEQTGQSPNSSAWDSPNLVVAVFYEDDRVQAAVLKLEELGFKSDDIGVSLKDLPMPLCDDSVHENTVLNGATTGVLGGGVMGGVFGLLMSVGAVLPEVGAAILGGAVGVTLASIGLGAASGGVLGSLIGLKVSPDERHTAPAQLFTGGVLVVVEAGLRNEEAKSILIESGGDLGPTNAAEVLGSSEERRAYFS
jgi:uncharacterized membrane protein